MASLEHLRTLRAGVTAWNKWRDANPETIPLLSGANLDAMDLRMANLRGAHMRGCSLRSTILDGASFLEQEFRERGREPVDLIHADLTDASLKRVRFFHSYLSRAIFRRADLSDAVLEDCALHETIFDGANLTGCDFYSSYMGSASFGNVDLSSALNLDMILHLEPSSIGLDAVIRSKGQINQDFLRAVGLPESIVAAIPALGQPRDLKYRGCFVSYSHDDADFVGRLYSALQASGVRCWLDKHDLLPGEDMLPAIHRAISRGNRVLLCCSKSSLNSWWVQREVELTFERERASRSRTPILIPLALDDALFKSTHPFAILLKHRSAVDFRQHADDFEESLSRLLRALSLKTRSIAAKRGSRRS